MAGLRPSHSSRPKVSLFVYRPAEGAGAFGWAVNDGHAKLNRFAVQETRGRTWDGVETRAQRNRTIAQLQSSLMSEVTRILGRIESGDPQAAEQLLPLVYDELRKLAAQKLTHEAPGQTLQATALVHEAYLRLVGDGQALQWDSRGHFFGAAAEAMRRILVDRARRKGRNKRGGDFKRLDIDSLDLVTESTPQQLLAIDEALAKLARNDPAAAQIVELRYFAGLTVGESSKVLGISTATAYRHWNYARAWLHNELLGTAE